MKQYPSIEATLGADWLYTWAGRLTDVELQRQETHSLELLKSAAHEAECRSAAEALLRERARKRVKPADWCPHGRPPHEQPCDDCAESDAEECAL